MKKCKECGREEWGFLSVFNEDGYCPRCAVAHYEEKIKKLQKQIDEANNIIKQYCFYEYGKPYLQKWGVK
ncbi:MAG: hypothetical protein J6T10_30055 [Methanobrevibacter sp.]|nr:hypothetical protein [Methanobrevibacter sp.]